MPDPWAANRPEGALPGIDVEPGRTCLISITEPGRLAALPDQFVNATAILRQQFDDMEPGKPFDKPPRFGVSAQRLPFTPEQAREMADFLLKHRGQNFIVHCAAGISRSGAVVDAILTAFPEYQDAGWPRHPNGHVRSLLKRALGLVPIGAENA